MKIKDAKIKLLLKQAYTSIDIGFSDSSSAATERAICFLSSLYSVIQKKPESESIVIVGRKDIWAGIYSSIISFLNPSTISNLKDEVVNIKDSISLGLSANNIPSRLAIKANSAGIELSIACGMAIGNSLANKSNDIYVIVAEEHFSLQNLWDAVDTASTESLSRIFAVSHLQINEPMDIERKLKGFGWDVSIIDSYDINKIFEEILKNRISPKFLLLT